VVKETIPKVEAAGDSLEYYLALAEMLHHVHDSHLTAPYSPHMTSRKGGFSPNLELKIVEEQLTVTYAAPATGLKVGEVIRSVNGVRTEELLGDQARFLSASSPQALRHALARRALRGQKDSVIDLAVEDASRHVRTVTVRRDTPLGAAGRRPEDRRDPVRILKEEIGYVDLSRLSLGQVDSMIEKLGSFPGIIFDLRWGGRSTGREIAARLVTRERNGKRRSSYRVPGFQGRTAMYPSLRADFVGYGEQAFSSQHSWPYAGKSVLLIDESLRSSVEGLANRFRYANGTILVGSPTMGANGDVTRFTVPGGIAISFTGVEMWYGDRQQQQRVGVVPDILVEPSLAGIREDSDEALDMAIEVMRGSISRPN